MTSPTLQTWDGTLRAGLYRMPEPVYRHEVEALNWSTFKHAASSPAEARRRERERKPSTAAQRRNQLIHALVLEPDAVDVQFVAARTGTGSRAWNAEQTAAGRVVVSGHDWKEARAQATYLRGHSLVAHMLEAGEGELVAIWQQRVTLESGPVEVWCKGKVDLTIFGAAGVRIADLKAGSSTDPDAFVRTDVVRNNFHGQLAYYSHGVREALRQSGQEALAILRPCWMVHSGADVVVVPMHDEAEEADGLADDEPSTMQRAGTALWQRALSRYVEAQRSGVWEHSRSDYIAHPPRRTPDYLAGRGWQTWAEQGDEPEDGEG